MEQTFVPERDLPDELWEFLADHPTDEGVSEALEELEAEEIVELFRAYIQARSEFVQELSGTNRADGASEDTLDDLAEELIRRGKDSYLDTYHGRKDLPPREQWDGFSGLVHLFVDFYSEHFEGELFDEIEE
jgi:hypothetical protein